MPNVKSDPMKNAGASHFQCFLEELGLPIISSSLYFPNKNNQLIGTPYSPPFTIKNKRHPPSNRLDVRVPLVD